jgi:hypothetical protein
MVEDLLDHPMVEGDHPMEADLLEDIVCGGPLGGPLMEEDPLWRMDPSWNLIGDHLMEEDPP